MPTLILTSKSQHIYFKTFFYSGFLYTGALDLGRGGFPKIISAAFSAIIMTGPLMFPLTTLGMIDASTILRFSTPNTSVLLLTTAIGSSSEPILQVHDG